MLVDKDALLNFLQGAQDADDVTAYFERVRLAKATVSKRKIRSLIREDRDPLYISSLPDSLRLAPGRLEVTFATVDELAESMYALARILDSDLDNFANAFEVRALEVNPESDEVARMFEELAELEDSYRVPER
ncbi:hypothetical protein HDF16_006193 [Granulicella aggregans]|uniref:Uncharacterized protein n=1 Tax=Granulicella aggregans TaxID=474949 RepID=A0A7W8E788_9BACT|nr:hypothetical protein [Granulicella aggregans]MBB5061457.1 hypothetical protein [Granulicella aggregans]